MTELEEFAEALFGQLSVELGEEKEIAGLAERIAGDASFGAAFEPLGDVAAAALPEMRAAMEGFCGFGGAGGVGLEAAGLREFKLLKGRKVFAAPGSRGFVDDLFAAVADADRGAVAGLMERDLARYLVYSTYAIQYLSKISTTYGDCLDGRIYLNDFVLSSYPRIVLYKQGPPFDAGRARVESGYRGAVKMTVLEELVHSQQGSLQGINREAAESVNAINEELAGIILAMGDSAASSLYDHMQLQAVPDDFPVARRANLFFMLNPDNFIVNVLGPDVMTYTKIDVDPRIAEAVPELPGVYRRWLGPIQAHHAAFTAMEGMAEFVVEGVLGGDPDFAAYLSTFAGTDVSAYMVRKGMGRDFFRAVHAGLSGRAFGAVLESPPTTRELKDPGSYLDRVGRG